MVEPVSERDVYKGGAGRCSTSQNQNPFTQAACSNTCYVSNCDPCQTKFYYIFSINLQ